MENEAEIETEINFMEKACNIAFNSVNNNGGPFGCVIVNNLTNEIISEGNNNVTKTNDPTAHAEIVAIRNACKTLNTYILENCTIYSSCEPCPMCLSAIYWSRIKKIYYANTRKDAENIGFDDSHIYNEFLKPMEQRTVKITQLKTSNYMDSFELWNNKTDKIEY
jgi:tRNA(Arg) A34 adenosine deaminase TadA